MFSAKCNECKPTKRLLKSQLGCVDPVSLNIPMKDRGFSTNISTDQLWPIPSDTFKHADSYKLEIAPYNESTPDVFQFLSTLSSWISIYQINQIKVSINEASDFPDCSMISNFSNETKSKIIN